MDVSPVRIQRYFSGVNYPTSKTDLIKRARDNGADNATVRALEGLTAQRFDSLADVTQALAKS